MNKTFSNIIKPVWTKEMRMMAFRSDLCVIPVCSKIALQYWWWRQIFIFFNAIKVLSPPWEAQSNN